MSDLPTGVGNLSSLRSLLNTAPPETKIALIDSYVRVRIGGYENAFPTGLLFSEIQELDLE